MIAIRGRHGLVNKTVYRYPVLWRWRVVIHHTTCRLIGHDWHDHNGDGTSIAVVVAGCPMSRRIREVRWLGLAGGGCHWCPVSRYGYGNPRRFAGNGDALMTDRGIMVSNEMNAAPGIWKIPEAADGSPSCERTAALTQCTPPVHPHNNEQPHTQPNPCPNGGAA